jgi:histone deacetylase 11
VLGAKLSGPEGVPAPHAVPDRRLDFGGQASAGAGLGDKRRGGFHHCSGSKGGGFCVYADITLLIHFVFNHHPRTVQNVMILDLDAHQGNGYQRDFKDNPNVYIIDVYNKGIYPFDGRAKDYINRKVELRHFTEDGEYLDEVAKNFDEALREFSPQLIVYNAGTDILKGDPLGCLSVSPQVRRLEIY